MTRRWKRTFPVMSAFLVGLSVFVAAVPQHGQRFNRQWGSNFRPNPDADRWRRDEERRRRPRHHPSDAREMIAHWNTIAIDAAGLDHTEVGPGEERVFGEEFGPGRLARAMAMVHIAIFDAANAIAGRYRGFSQMPHVPEWTSMEAAVASAAHDALVAMYPSQAEAMNEEMAEDLVGLPNGPAKTAGIRLGQRAAALIIQSHTNDGSQFDDPLIGTEFVTKTAPGKWRQDPIGLQPIALGATWGQVKPFVIPSGARFRVPRPPPLTSDEYTEAYNEVKRFGGDGITTPTERAEEQSFIGAFWAYYGTPSLCAPPRVYNQITMTIANKMHTTNPVELARLFALVNTAMADAGIASWQLKYDDQFWLSQLRRFVNPTRHGSATGLGDGNADTAGYSNWTPLGAPASNLSGPNFTPPFPGDTSGHATFGGAIFHILLRHFYGTDSIPFTIVSDEWNGITMDNQGHVRPLRPRTFNSLSEAEEENGQSRIYLGNSTSRSTRTTASIRAAAWRITCGGMG